MGIYVFGERVRSERKSKNESVEIGAGSAGSCCLNELMRL